MRPYLPIILCVSFIYCSCQKKQHIYDAIDPHLKLHYTFKPGSYWIYRDSITTQEDSFVVFRKQSGTYLKESNQVRDVEREYIDMFIHQYRNGILIDTVNWTITLEYKFLSFGNGATSSQCYFLTNPTYVNTSILGATYENVIPYDSRRNNFMYYFKDDVGIVKFSFITLGVEEILRYQIQ